MDIKQAKLLFNGPQQPLPCDGDINILSTRGTKKKAKQIKWHKWVQIQETSRKNIKNGAYRITFFGEKADYST